MSKVLVIMVIISFLSGLANNINAIPTPAGESVIGDDVGVLDHYPDMKPSSADDYYKLGIMYLAKNMAYEAEKQFHEALKLDPEHLDSLVGLVVTSLRQGDVGSAADFSNKAIQIQPDSADLHNLLGLRWMADARFVEAERAYTEAERQFREALSLDKKSAAAHANLARLYIVKKRTEDAMKEYRSAIVIDPKNPELRRELAYIYLNTGHADKGLIEAQEMVKLSPQNPSYRNGLGEIYMNGGQMEKALAEFQQTVKLDPKYAPAYTNMGKLYLVKRLFDKAIEDFHKALSYKVDYGEAYSGLGDAYFLKGDRQKATEQYEKAIGKDAIGTLSMRAFASVYNNLAYIYSEDEGRDLDKALSYAQKAKQVLPNHPGIADTLGWIYYKKGNYDEALVNLKVAAEATPDDPTISYHLGAAYYMKGLQEQAKAELSRSLSISDEFDGAEEAKRLLAKLGAQ